MQKTLDKLYAYALEHDELGKACVPNEEKYQQENEIYDKLERSLTEEQRELFEKFFELYHERVYFEDERTFRYAFQHGVLLAFELFEEKKG